MGPLWAMARDIYGHIWAHMGPWLGTSMGRNGSKWLEMGPYGPIPDTLWAMAREIYGSKWLEMGPYGPIADTSENRDWTTITSQKPYIFVFPPFFFSFSWFYANFCFLFVSGSRSLAKNRIQAVSSLPPYFTFWIAFLFLVQIEYAFLHGTLLT